MEQQSAPSKGSGNNDTVMAAVATIPIVGLIIYFGMSDASPVVKHYAKQGIGILLMSVVSMVINVIPFLGQLLSCLITIIVFVAWLLILVKALQGVPNYKLPVVGDFFDSMLK